MFVQDFIWRCFSSPYFPRLGPCPLIMYSVYVNLCFHIGIVGLQLVCSLQNADLQVCGLRFAGLHFAATGNLLGKYKSFR